MSLDTPVADRVVVLTGARVEVVRAELAQEPSGRKGIRVNALCPGYFESEMTRDQEPLRDVVVAEIMLGRFGEQRELDAALNLLASPASSYVTGTSLLVDGGLSAL